MLQLIFLLMQARKIIRLRFFIIIGLAAVHSHVIATTDKNYPWNRTERPSKLIRHKFECKLKTKKKQNDGFSRKKTFYSFSK